MKIESLNKILKPSGVVFTEKGHTYVNELTKELYTGCTTISDAWAKDFLGPWYAKEMMNFILSEGYDKIHAMNPDEFAKFIEYAKSAARRKGDQAKDDGSEVHDAIENMILAKVAGKKKFTSKKLNTPEAQNAVNAFIEWVKDKNITWLASEEVIASHEHRIAGKLDSIFVLDGITYLADFKTSSQISPSYLLQAAGYDIMLREMGLQVMGYIIIRTPKDGSPVETLTITNRDDMAFFRDTFLKQREAHKFYSYMESKFKDATTRKMRVDEKIEPVKVEKRKKVSHGKA